ncbi:MAG: NAD-dependent epimerase/dehydratase family protein [Acidimicrobiales bacterium]
MSRPAALLVGGTGPTGPHIAAGLEARGHTVTVLHTGGHEIDDVAHLEHLHADVKSGAAVAEAIGDRTFDVAVVTYGRLREIAEVLVGRVGQFLSVGGAPAYRGFFDAGRWDPAGMPVPTGEHAPKSDEGDDGKSYRVRRTEEAVFEHHPAATHFRYPFVYGPRQPVPRDWYFVRRMLDGRDRIVVPDGGLTLMSSGYVENLAHGLVLAVGNDRAAGEVFNLADREVLTLSQAGACCAAELGVEVVFESIPWALAPCTRPLVGQDRTTHRVLDVAKAVERLGYTDVVPAREAVARTARWLVDHRPEPGGFEERILEDPFDYEAEDHLLAWWDQAVASFADPYTARDEASPGYGLHYGGPGASYQRPDTRI